MPLALQLPSAGAAKDENKLPFYDKAMHFVEQFGYFRYLVDKELLLNYFYVCGLMI